MKNLSRTVGILFLVYLFPSFQDAFFIGALFAVSVQGSMLINADGDIGRHITIGNYISQHWQIPTSDIFSHTMYGQRLVPHEWLAQWIFSRFHAWMGLNGVVAATAILIAAAFTLVYHEIRKRGSSMLVALTVASLAGFASSLHWIARPHVFTFVLLAVWAYLLADRNSKIWYFPVIMLIWANTHGAFITGFAIWLAHMVGWVWDALHKKDDCTHGIRLAVIGASSFAATFINPSGWHLWNTSASYYGNPFLVNATIEYLSPNFHNWSTWPFLLMLAICLMGIGLKTKFQAYEGFLIAGWTMLSLYSARNIPLFAIVTAPYVATIIQENLPQIPILQRIETSINNVERNHKGILLPLLSVSVILGTSISLKGRIPANNFDPNKFPVQAVDWLENHPQEGEMFNNFIWGGYILYRMFPQELVFIDGQTDFYGEEFSLEYAKVMKLEDDWEDVLSKYDVSWVIVESYRPLVPVLQNELNWKIVYQDETAVILHKP